jgi:hypothetical protein
MTAKYIPSLAPPDFVNPVIEEYKSHLDESLLRENLRLSISERVKKAARAIEAVEHLRGIANVTKKHSS